MQTSYPVEESSSRYAVDSVIGPKQQYQLTELLQSGSHYELFRAYDTFLSRHVSLCLFSKESKPAASAQLNALAGISHPNVLPLLDAFQEDGHPVHIVKDIDPFLLNDLINEDTALDGEQIKFLAPQICDALIAFHEGENLHLGINPSNISLFCSPDGRCRYTLLNLSFSKKTDEEGKCAEYDSSILEEQFHYAAPEALAVDEVDARTDLFSLGASLYAIFAGKPPFKAKSPVLLAESHRSESPEHLSSIRSDISPSIADWVMSLLEVNPEHRPESAKAALESFQKAVRTSHADWQQNSQVA